MKLLVALILLVLLAMACATVPNPSEISGSESVHADFDIGTPIDPGVDFNCDDNWLRRQVRFISEDEEVQILGISPGAEELVHAHYLLRCRGQARIARGPDIYLVYFYEVKGVGDGYIDYRIGYEGDAYVGATPRRMIVQEYAAVGILVALGVAGVAALLLGLVAHRFARW